MILSFMTRPGQVKLLIAPGTKQSTKEQSFIIIPYNNWSFKVGKQHEWELLSLSAFRKIIQKFESE